MTFGVSLEIICKSLWNAWRANRRGDVHFLLGLQMSLVVYNY